MTSDNVMTPKRRKYRQDFLDEVARFEQSNSQLIPVPRTEEGLAQFFDLESKGIRPETPDPYCTYLENGKAWWEWTLNNIADTFDSRDWVGWFQYAKDFYNDPRGFSQLRNRCNFPSITPYEYICNNLLKGEFFWGDGI